MLQREVFQGVAQSVNVAYSDFAEVVSGQGDRKLAISMLQRCLGAESEPHRIVMKCK